LEFHLEVLEILESFDLDESRLVGIIALRPKGRIVGNSEVIRRFDDPNSALECTKNEVFGNYDPPPK
jgi:hypothetical protein